MTRTRRAILAAERCERQADILARAGYLADAARSLANAAAWRALPEVN